jgi:O-antigen/teichoic acid export membrane protein
VAMYNPAIRISNLVEVPTLAIANVVFPQVGSALKNSGVSGIQNIYYKSLSLILAVMLPAILPIYLLSDYIILYIFGEAYAEASPILQVTIFYMLLVPFSRQFGTILDGLKMPKLNFYLLLILVAINAIMNYFMLKEYGVIGAAYSTLLSYLLIVVVNQIVLYFKFGINTWSVIVETFRWYGTGFHWIKERLK